MCLTRALPLAPTMPADAADDDRADVASVGALVDRILWTQLPVPVPPGRDACTSAHVRAETPA